MTITRKQALAVTFLASQLLLSGCIPALVGAGATTGGVVVAQERSAGNAMDDAGMKLTIDNIYLNQDINDLFKNVHVHVSEARVLLTGAVVKQQTKEDAVRLAWRARGVREVIDEIQVNGDSGIADYARDTWISAQVRSRLLFEKNVRSINYNIETVNGTVYLLGIAQDQDELNKATYLASTTKYVKQVVSHVLLKNDPRRAAYARDPGPQDQPVHPHSNDSDRATPGGDDNRPDPGYHDSVDYKNDNGR